MNKNSGNTKKKCYYAFFDAEYTCFMERDTFFDREHSGELLSVGLVICDKNFNMVRTYYSPIHPFYNTRLTGYCKELTGLTQKEIDEAPSYEAVFQEMYLLFQEYPVKEIFTWGNDAHTIRHDIEKNHRFVAKRFRRIAGLLQDVTKRLTRRVYGKGITLSLSDMKYVCGMKHHTAHNALEDAKDLYRITRCIVQGKFDRERADRLEEYIHRRDAYHQYKRFKKPLSFTVDAGQPVESGRLKTAETTAGENRPESSRAKAAGTPEAAGQRQPSARNLREASMQYIGVLKDSCRKEDGMVPPEILALCDDIRSLIGVENVDCPKLEE